MICIACGYSDIDIGKSYDGGPIEPIVKAGEKPFIELHGATTCRDKDLDYPLNVTLYACPNCGTVRMEV